jgi:hypothetical protein
MPNKDSAKRGRAKKRGARKPFVFSLSERERAIVQNWEALSGLSPKETAVVDNCGLSTVYERCASGEYEAYKDGARTKITTKSIKARRAKLRPAAYKSLPQPTHAA